MGEQPKLSKVQFPTAAALPPPAAWPPVGVVQPGLFTGLTALMGSSYDVLCAACVISMPFSDQQPFGWALPVASDPGC